MTAVRTIRGPRTARALATLVALCTAAVVAVPAAQPEAAAATYQDPVLTGTYHVAPGLDRQLYRWQTIGGPQRIQVLRSSLTDDRVQLRPELADGIVPGREPVNRTVARLGSRAVAGVNGGFWLDSPTGDPEGLVVQDGRYLSEPATQGVGPRAAFALFPQGAHAVGRPGYKGAVWFPSGRSAKLAAVNRQPRDGELVAFTADYAARTGTPAGTVEAVFDGLDLEVETLTSALVSQVRGNDGALARHVVVLAGRGSWASALESLRPGDRVTFDTRMSEDWRGATQALAAGPLILQDGQITSSQSWEIEGFSNRVHNDRAHPRTVVGFTPDRQLLLVAIDGRQSGAVGLTTQETADLMRRLGAVDAVMMDGGGSTTMVTDGRVENRPSDGFARSVSNALVLYSNVGTPDVTRLQGSSRWATAANAARRGWPNGSTRALLANGLNFPDGIAGGPLAAKLDAPLLLTLRDRVPPETVAALQALGVRDLTILGGKAAVDDPVAIQLHDLGIALHRRAGRSRAGTAAAIAAAVGAPTHRALLASGNGFADALSATVPAAAANAPLLLTARETLSPETAAVIDQLGIRQVVVVGGSAAVSDQVLADLRARGVSVSRVAGADRYTTATRIVEWAEQTVGYQPRGVALASGADFPDALAGGPFGAHRGVPVLLTQPYDIDRSPATRRWVDAHRIDQAYLLGGRVAVASWVAYQLEDAHNR